MAWVTAWTGKIIGLDTAPLIYYIEQNTKYLDIVQPFFQAIDRGDVVAVTSTLTLAEVLVHPLRLGKAHLATQYRQILLSASGLKTVDLDSNIAEQTARLRSQYNLRTPDAIHLATAVAEGAAAFLTNDAALPSFPGLDFLNLDTLRKKSTGAN